MLEVLGIAFLILIAIAVLTIIFAILRFHFVILPYIRAEAHEGAVAEGYVWVVV